MTMRTRKQSLTVALGHAAAFAPHVFAIVVVAAVVVYLCCG
jgi:threonine/homoserine/homoserine lactone efflux protein